MKRSTWELCKSRYYLHSKSEVAMKVISPGFEILDDYFVSGRILEQIERCGRVCYKSEDKITAESAPPFIKGIIKRGHESVIEMAQVVMRVRAGSAEPFHEFFELIPRFCQASRTGENEFIISGNPRSFRDLARRHPKVAIVGAAARLLSKHCPVVFEDLMENPELSDGSGIDITLLEAREVDALPPDLLAKHRTLLLHITVNRAVTHELVRHRVASYLQESQRYCRYGEAKFGGEVVFIKPCFYEEDSPEYALWKEAMEETERIYLKLLETSSPQAARTVLPNSCKTEIMVNATLEEWYHILRLRASRAADPSMREIMLQILPEMIKRFPQIFEPLKGLLEDIG